MRVLKKVFNFIILLFSIVYFVNSARVRHHSGGKQVLKYLNHGIGKHHDTRSTGNVGLWPSVFNLATKALITVNATCGEGGREEFCRIAEGPRSRCGICDNFSIDPTKKHPIHHAIDGTGKWWQSPALYNGLEYEFVTVTLDLKQIYQVAYVIMKAANSPRPGAWILEKSVDGIIYVPWQYFARNDKECLERYGVPATKGKPHYLTDTDVICSTYYSKLNPMENGEIHTFLVLGRPGANETSPELLEFTKARYVRLRFQGFRGSVDPLPKWLSQDLSKNKRLFYSIRDISIGGQCVCNGHASTCRHNVASGHPECECSHNACGPNCETCCPLYNQRQWGPGSSRDSRRCLSCNCHGHATSCHYDETIDRAGLSLDINGNYQGGGVCDNCTNHTTGTNCQLCLPGYYRPFGATPDHNCIECDCNLIASTGNCVQEGLSAGFCECRIGYQEPKCNTCAPGYRGYPNCEVCPCDERGVVPYNNCDRDCTCKINVEGQNCNRCKSGHFALRFDNPEGCAACYCSGVTTLCESAIIASRTFETIENWLISDLSVTDVVKPTWDVDRYLLSIGNYEIPDIEAYYWLAPKLYLGNKLEFYGSSLVFKVHWVIMRGDTSGKPTTGPNIILIGHNGMQIALGDDLHNGTNTTLHIKFTEHGWYHIPKGVKDIITRLKRTEYRGDPVTHSQFLQVLTNIKHILLRAKYHTDQIEGLFEQVLIKLGNDNEAYNAVEKCSCPSGYAGLSCESCEYGYVGIVTNTSQHHEQGFCIKCDCNGHSETCNPDTGECFCEHNTFGEKCERCLPGYYGNPMSGTSADCRKCACPLLDESNNFSPSCQLDYSSITEDEGGNSGYVCTQCPKGYTGDHCEICDDGFFGNPLELGSKCQECSCGGSPCDRLTGQCLGCKGNTEGWRCERCKSGYFGDAAASNCQPCICNVLGSVSPECNNITGQCFCKERFTGRTCQHCEDGYGNITALCKPCTCNSIGSKSAICDSHTGLCDCQPGIEGFQCDACQHLHYGFSQTGCQSKF